MTTTRESLARTSRWAAPWLWEEPRPSWWVVAAAVGVYVLQWGVSIVGAVLNLLDRWPLGRWCTDVSSAAGCVAPAWDRALFSLSMSPLWRTALVVLACLMVMGLLRLPRDAFKLAGARSGWAGEGWAGFCWFVGIAFIGIAMWLTPGNEFPLPRDLPPVFQAMQLVDIPVGGAVEELWFGPVLVTILVRFRVPLWGVLVTAGALRGAFHVYYGPPVWSHVLWGALLALVYYATGRWVMLFLLHLLHDLFATAWALEFHDFAWCVLAVYVAGFLLSWFLVYRGIKHLKSMPSAADAVPVDATS